MEGGPAACKPLSRRLALAASLPDPAWTGRATAGRPVRRPIGSLRGARIAAHGSPDGLEELPLGLRVGRQGSQGKREYGIELPELRKRLLGPLPKLLARILKCLFLAILERSHDVKPGKFLKLLKFHW